LLSRYLAPSYSPSFPTRRSSDLGLRPEETPDVEITSTVPGQGNFPLHPHYLAIPMPWPSWRHMPDQDLWAIAAYLKNGLKPVSQDRKSTRLNSSHVAISYAVFCL